MNILEIENLSYSYNPEKKVLKGINHCFKTKTMYSIMGQSGSGKTTLLNLISGLETIAKNKGDILFQSKSLTTLDLDQYRAHDIGLIFQGYNLITKYSVFDNLKIALKIAKIKKNDLEILDCLESLGISKKMSQRKIYELSGGQQQRVAIARALIKDSKLIIADEPTGNLDNENEKNLLDIFKTLTTEKKICVIIVTHSREVAKRSDISLILKHGILQTT